MKSIKTLLLSIALLASFAGVKAMNNQNLQRITDNVIITANILLINTINNKVKKVETIHPDANFNNQR